MNVNFYSPIYFEQWDHRSPDNPGIGGSETAVVELAARLAQRGHSVTVYAPIRDDCPPNDRGATWLPLDQADFTQPGLWVLSRCPQVLDSFTRWHDDQQTWLICQDVFYPSQVKEGLTKERIAKLDLCLPLCTAQERYLTQIDPELKGKIRLSSNGIKVDLIKRIDQPTRDPFKLIGTSSPDRYLPTLLRIFRRAKEFEPRLTLTVAYGWDNISKCKGKYWINVRKECEELTCDGVTFLGRLGQEALYREFLSSGIWCYPTTFTETSCITCMEAQALGAIPITNPIWALEDNVRHGTFLTGDPGGEPLVMTSYVGEILRLTRDLELQEQVRGPMMIWARDKFDWDRIVDQYEHWMEKRSTVIMLPDTVNISAPGHPDWRVLGYLQEEELPLVDHLKQSHLDCNIIITTVDRPKVSKSQNYIRQCIESVGDHFLDLMPDCGDTSYIGNHFAGQIHRWSNDRLLEQDMLLKTERAAVNYHRCLTMDRFRDALIMEDDAVLSPDWEHRVLSALAKIPDSRFILSVYHNWTWAMPKTDDPVIRFHPMVMDSKEDRLWTWAGVAAVYYPASVLRSDLPEFLLARYRDAAKVTFLYDALVGLWCHESKVPIYLMNPPAAEHVATISSIGWMN